MIGASAGAAGRSGYVPTPTAGQQDRVLFGDATWRNLGTLTFKGVVAAASLPASSAVAGDYYVIGTAGTIYSITFAVGDQAIWSGSVWQKVTPGTTQIGEGGTGGTTAAEARTNIGVHSKEESFNLSLSRPLRGGLAFDGLTTSAKVLSLLGNLSASDFTISLTFRVPEANPAGSAGLFVMGPSSSTYVADNAVYVYISTAGLLSVGRRGATGATDYRVTQVSSSIVTGYAGKTVAFSAVKSGASLVIYIDGVAQATADITGGTVPAWSDGVSTAYAYLGPLSTADYYYSGLIQLAAVFNRALSAAEVLALANNGVSEADKWGNISALVSPSLLNGGFETLGGGGADVFGTWSENPSGTGTVAVETSGPYAGANSLKLNGGASGTAQIYQAVPLVYRKTYRITYYGKSTGGGSVMMRVGGLSPTPQTLTGSWVKYSFDVVNTGSVPTYFYVESSSNTDVLIDDITVTQIGAILDVDLEVGVGYQAPDRSSNNYHGDITTSGVSHAIENYDGLHTIVKTFAHSDISSTAATTLLCTLPKNCGIVEVEFNRTAAFDSGITADVGISGTSNKHVSAQSLVGTTIAWADSLSKASESNSANTSVWIKKSGATTVGAVTVRITYRVRNK